MTFSVFRFDFLEFGIWVFFILSDGLTIFSSSIIFLISIFFWNNWRRGGRFCKNTLWIGGFVFWFLFMIFVFQLKLVKNELQTVGYILYQILHTVLTSLKFICSKKVTNIWRNLPFNCQIFVAFTEYMNIWFAFFPAHFLMVSITSNLIFQKFVSFSKSSMLTNTYSSFLKGTYV